MHMKHMIIIIHWLNIRPNLSRCHNKQQCTEYITNGQKEKCGGKDFLSEASEMNH